MQKLRMIQRRSMEASYCATEPGDTRPITITSHGPRLTNHGPRYSVMSPGLLCGAVSSTGNARPVPRGRVMRQTKYKIVENTTIRNHQGAFR